MKQHEHTYNIDDYTRTDEGFHLKCLECNEPLTINVNTKRDYYQSWDEWDEDEDYEDDYDYEPNTYYR